MLRAKVSPFAYDLVMAQYSLSLNYRAELLPDQDDVDVWHRKYRVMSNVADTDNKYEYNSEGDLVTDAPEDFGLWDSNSSCRIASIVECSCQFGIASGLDLCRHRMNRVAALIDEINPSEYGQLIGVNIADKWLVLSAADEADATRRLRLQPKPKPFSVPATAAAPIFETPCDRYGLLLAEFKMLAEAASESPSVTQAVLRNIRTLHEQVLSGVSPTVATAQGPSTTEVHGEPTASDGEYELSTPEVSKDWLDLQKAMGSEYVLADDKVDDDYFGPYDEEEGLQGFGFWMDDAIIAYKWKTAGNRERDLTVKSGHHLTFNLTMLINC